MIRRFPVPPERVFAAWTDPELVALWLFRGPTSEAHETSLDVRIGGRWQISDTRAGTKYTALGEYLEIDPPHRLAFTFVGAPSPPKPSAADPRPGCIPQDHRKVAHASYWQGDADIKLKKAPVLPGLEGRESGGCVAVHVVDSTRALQGEFRIVNFPRYSQPSIAAKGIEGRRELSSAGVRPTGGRSGVPGSMHAGAAHEKRSTPRTGAQ